MPKNTKKCRKAIQKRKKKTTFTPKEKISRVMEEKTFFTAKEREQLFTLYKRLLHLSGDTLQKNDCRKLKTHLIKAVAEGSMPRNNFGMNPIIKDMQTAVIVAEEIGMKRASILGIMLHESVKNHLCSLASVQAEYGEDVAGIIRGLVKINELYAKSPTIESENFRNLLLSFAEDMRVILIMIADRVNLMRQIKDSENEEARQQVSNEAAYLYAPLAHKLGLYKLKSELEDLSLKYTEHDVYYHIKDKLNATKASRDKYIAAFIEPIQKKLEQAGLKFHMKGRTKSIHSIYQKMKKQKCPFEGVYDLFAIRIIIDSPIEKEKQECWQVYSIVTDMYMPNPKRLRDWLSVPKSNGYESLHTTVMGPEGKWVEVQIRTERIIHEDKEYLKGLLNDIQGICDELGLFINPKKTQIVKLSHGFTFLKIKYNLTETGKVQERISKDSVTRMRRKLKKFRKLMDAGEMSFDDVRCAYASWKGGVSHYDSYNVVKSMDKLFDELFIHPFIGGGHRDEQNNNEQK